MKVASLATLVNEFPMSCIVRDRGRSGIQSSGEKMLRRLIAVPMESLNGPVEYERDRGAGKQSETEKKRCETRSLLLLNR